MVKITEWQQELPASCPPSDAVCPEGQTFFRLVNPDGITSECFLPTPPKFGPSAKWTLCHFKSVSIFNTLQDLTRALKIGDHKTKSIISLKLPPGSGLISKTGSSGHYSWWRAAQFDPVANSNPLTD